MSTVLIVSNRKDQHARDVAQRLRRDGHRPIVLDPARFPTPATATVTFDRAPPTLRFDGIDLRTVDTVWMRRCTTSLPNANLDASARGFAAVQMTSFLWGLCDLTPARWVNPIAAIAGMDGGNGKFRQLEVARSLGLTIPRTCATSDPAAARAFVASCGAAGAIYKPFRSTSFRAVYTTLLTGTEDFELVRGAPCIFQERIPKAFEVRCVVAGDRVMATAIHSQEQPTARVDFRLNYAVPHVAHDLPREVAELLVLHLRACGLEFGAYDLIVTPDGRYVFLEVNQQGQWLWLEERTGQDYVGFVAEFLARAPRMSDPPVTIPATEKP